MSLNVQDAISALMQNNASGFQDAVNDVLGDKLRERIGVEKVAVAQNMFNTADEAPELEYEEDGDTDEDI